MFRARANEPTRWSYDRWSQERPARTGVVGSGENFGNAHDASHVTLLEATACASSVRCQEVAAWKPCSEAFHLESALLSKSQTQCEPAGQGLT